MTYNLWPFLVGCNKASLDYRTIVNPLFLNDSNATQLLARNALGDKTPDNAVICKYINFQGRDLTMFYKVFEANFSDIGFSEFEILRDEWGRKIYLIKGVVFEHNDKEIKLGPKLFNKINELTLIHYKKFWEFSEKDWIAVSCDYFEYRPEEEPFFFENIFIEPQNKPIRIKNKTDFWVEKSSFLVSKFFETNVNLKKLHFGFQDESETNLVLLHENYLIHYDLDIEKVLEKKFHLLSNHQINKIFFIKKKQFSIDQIFLCSNKSIFELFENTPTPFKVEIDYDISAITSINTKDIENEMLYIITGDYYGVLRLHDFITTNKHFSIEKKCRPNGLLNLNKSPILDMFFLKKSNIIVVLMHDEINLISVKNYNNPDKVSLFLNKKINFKHSHNISSGHLYENNNNINFVILDKKNTIYTYSLGDIGKATQPFIVDEMTQELNCSNFAISQNGANLITAIDNNGKNIKIKLFTRKNN